MCIMRFDPTPFYRSTIGFDKLFNLLDNVSENTNMPNGFPPYNIQRLADEKYRITMAVAGFDADEISVEVTGNFLTVTGKHASEEHDKNEVEFLYRGIAGRDFERRFQLADHVEVKDASLKNGLLHIKLDRVVPEAEKTRKIPLTNANNTEAQELLNSEAA